MGGTGKTPMVILLAKLLREKGCRPAILSRGYGARTKAPVNAVSDGNRILMGWHEAGDEPVLIARSLSGVPVLTGPRRHLTGQAAIGHHGADILILDDAFQHRALYRDLDIVLIDAARPFGNGRLLPGGSLREPAKALGRAHLLIRTGDSREPEQPSPKIPEIPSFRGFHRPLGVVEGGTGALLPATSLQGQKVCAFAGIGSPESFRRSLNDLDSEIVSFRPFPDHHPYQRADIDSLRQLAAKTGANRIVTTEKDGVRIGDFPYFLAEVSLLEDRDGVSRLRMHLQNWSFPAWVLFNNTEMTEMVKCEMKAAEKDAPLAVRGGKKLAGVGLERLLIRGTNWIGDVVMTLPAVASIRKTWPGAQISILAKPWVAEIYRLSPSVDQVIVFQEPGRHAGVMGKLRLVGELRKNPFDCAILLQNAIEAAILTRLAGIPLCAGYNSDGRGLLLSHSVRRTKAVRQIHQIDYYLEMVRALGCMPAERSVQLHPGEDYNGMVEKLFNEYGIGAGHTLIGLAPGAAYGPAKKWFPERFATVVDRLMDDTGAQAILFGSGGDKESTAAVARYARHCLIDIAGKTNLKEAIALISRCTLFLSNDSGLMHVAGALGIPTVAIFGSTNPTTTSPVGERSIVIHRDVACSPCLKPICPTDFRCMDLIGVDEVYGAARILLKG